MATGSLGASLRIKRADQHVERRGRPRKWTGPIAEWMIASGIRADRLSEQVGVDLSTVFKWCRGEQIPTSDKVQVIVEIARRSGCRRKLTLEEIYARDAARIRSHIPRRLFNLQMVMRSRCSGE